MQLHRPSYIYQFIARQQESWTWLWPIYFTRTNVSCTLGWAPACVYVRVGICVCVCVQICSSRFYWVIYVFCILCVDLTSWESRACALIIMWRHPIMGCIPGIQCLISESSLIGEVKGHVRVSRVKVHRSIVSLRVSFHGGIILAQMRSFLAHSENVSYLRKSIRARGKIYFLSRNFDFIKSQVAISTFWVEYVELPSRYLLIMKEVFRLNKDFVSRNIDLVTWNFDFLTRNFNLWKSKFRLNFEL